MTQQYEGLAIFTPLGQWMTKQDPGQRPTASEALAQFDQLVMTMDSGFLHRTIRCKDNAIVSIWYRTGWEWRYICSLTFVFSATILCLSLILDHVIHARP
jgi:hypothetical protein